MHNGMRPIPPCEVAKEEFGLSFHPGLRVTPELALDLSYVTGTTPDFWLNLQAAYDAAKERG